MAFPACVGRQEWEGTPPWLTNLSEAADVAPRRTGWDLAPGSPTTSGNQVLNTVVSSRSRSSFLKWEECDTWYPSGTHRTHPISTPDVGLILASHLDWGEPGVRHRHALASRGEKVRERVAAAHPGCYNHYRLTR